MYAIDVVRRAGRELQHVVRADTPTHGALRDRVVAIALITVVLDLLCAVAALLFEQHVKPTQIDSYGSALFWTTTQMLTVSSQIQNPLSVGGRILDVAMEAYAMTVVATLAGSVGAFFIRRAHDSDKGGRGGR
jgi:hypothetical protein